VAIGSGPCAFAVEGKAGSANAVVLGWAFGGNKP
jgi:hypothetical protein